MFKDFYGTNLIALVLSTTAELYVLRKLINAFRCYLKIKGLTG